MLQSSAKQPDADLPDSHMRSLTFTNRSLKDCVRLLKHRTYLQTLPAEANEREWKQADLEVDLQWGDERDEDFDAALVCTATPTDR